MAVVFYHNICFYIIIKIIGRKNCSGKAVRVGRVMDTKKHL